MANTSPLSWGRGTPLYGASDEDYVAAFVTNVGSEECWDWKGRVNNSGYPVFKSHPAPVLAHRASYQMFKGVIPDGYAVDHLCNNRRCTNPNHLRAVTRDKNSQAGTHCPGCECREES